MIKNQSIVKNPPQLINQKVIPIKQINNEIIQPPIIQKEENFDDFDDYEAFFKKNKSTFLLTPHFLLFMCLLHCTALWTVYIVQHGERERETFYFLNHFRLHLVKSISNLPL